MNPGEILNLLVNFATKTEKKVSTQIKQTLNNESCTFVEFFCTPQSEKMNFEKNGSTASAYSQNRPTAAVNGVSWRLMTEDRTNAGGASTILEGSVKEATRFSINRRAWRKF